MIRLFKPSTLAVTALALVATACSNTGGTGPMGMNKTATYGLGGAAACGIAGAVTGNSKHARNAALGCGLVGAGVGAYMDYQERQLRERLANTQVDVTRSGDQIKLTMPDNITFAINSATLNPNVQTALADVANVLNQYPETSITVVGHTDNTGSASLNQNLSQRRAEAVSSYLQARGVTASRIRTMGMGPNQPIAGNDTEAGRAKNRRVEILINPQAAK